MADGVSLLHEAYKLSFYEGKEDAGDDEEDEDLDALNAKTPWYNHPRYNQVLDLPIPELSLKQLRARIRKLHDQKVILEADIHTPFYEYQDSQPLPTSKPLLAVHLLDTMDAQCAVAAILYLRLEFAERMEIAYNNVHNEHFHTTITPKLAKQIVPLIALPLKNKDDDSIPREWRIECAKRVVHEYVIDLNTAPLSPPNIATLWSLTDCLATFFKKNKIKIVTNNDGIEPETSKKQPPNNNNNTTALSECILETLNNPMSVLLPSLSVYRSLLRASESSTVSAALSASLRSKSHLEAQIKAVSAEKLVEIESNKLSRMVAQSKQRFAVPTIALLQKAAKIILDTPTFPPNSWKSSKRRIDSRKLLAPGIEPTTTEFDDHHRNLLVLKHNETDIPPIKPATQLLKNIVLNENLQKDWPDTINIITMTLEKTPNDLENKQDENDDQNDDQNDEKSVKSDKSDDDDDEAGASSLAAARQHLESVIAKIRFHFRVRLPIELKAHALARKHGLKSVLEGAKLNELCGKIWRDKRRKVPSQGDTPPPSDDEEEETDLPEPLENLVKQMEKINLEIAKQLWEEATNAGIPVNTLGLYPIEKSRLKVPNQQQQPIVKRIKKKKKKTLKPADTPQPSVVIAPQSNAWLAERAMYNRRAQERYLSQASKRYRN